MLLSKLARENRGGIAPIAVGGEYHLITPANEVPGWAPRDVVSRYGCAGHIVLQSCWKNNGGHLVSHDDVSRPTGQSTAIIPSYFLSC